jgi:hypothetical protein
VVFTDGLRHAGSLSGNGRYDPYAVTQKMWLDGITDARKIADTLLAEAVDRDDGRPRDDISVLVISVLANDTENKTRRLGGRLPL